VVVQMTGRVTQRVKYLELKLREQQLELFTLRGENVELKHTLEENERTRGQLETDLLAERSSRRPISVDPLVNPLVEELVEENAKLKRKIHGLSSTEGGSLADAELQRITKRRKLTLPDAKHRIDVRGLFQYHEVLHRWGGQDPKDYNDLTKWFRGKNDLALAPSGAQFWLNAMKAFGYDPQAYDAISPKHPLKLEIEHLYTQSLCGEDSSLRNGIMNLYLLENGYNRSAEFKESNTIAKLAFFGKRTLSNHRAYVRWRDTRDNRKLPSTSFLRSVHCTDTDLCTPRYMSSGLRSTGMTRQLRLVATKKNAQADERVPILVLK